MCTEEVDPKARVKVGFQFDGCLWLSYYIFAMVYQVY